jgi:hypothetical protein
VPGTLVEDHARNVSMMHSMIGEGINCAKRPEGLDPRWGAEGLHKKRGHNALVHVPPLRLARHNV